MTCPKCGGETYVRSSRIFEGKRVRKRICKLCGSASFTEEVFIDYLDGLNRFSNWHREEHKHRKEKHGS